VKRPGRDVTVVATAMMVHRALAAAERWRGGDRARGDRSRTWLPFDLATILQSVQKTGKLVVVHEEISRSAWRGCGGPGGGAGLRRPGCPPRRVTCLDVHMPYNGRWKPW